MRAGAHKPARHSSPRPGLLSIADAAEVLGVTPACVADRIRGGYLDGEQDEDCGLILLRREDVIAHRDVTEGLLTTREAAKEVGVPAGRIRKRISDGAIPTMWHLSQHWMTAADVRAALQ